MLVMWAVFRLTNSLPIFSDTSFEDVFVVMVFKWTRYIVSYVCSSWSSALMLLLVYMSRSFWWMVFFFKFNFCKSSPFSVFLQSVSLFQLSSISVFALGSLPLSFWYFFCTFLNYFGHRFRAIRCSIVSILLFILFWYSSWGEYLFWPPCSLWVRVLHPHKYGIVVAAG
jgi:hypothetical protein